MSESREGDGVHTETPCVGFRLRAFTERRFGVWEDGRVVRVDKRKKTVTVDFGRYKERRPFAYGAFFYPRGHPYQGDFFTFS